MNPADTLRKILAVALSKGVEGVVPWMETLTVSKTSPSETLIPHPFHPQLPSKIANPECVKALRLSGQISMRIQTPFDLHEIDQLLKSIRLLKNNLFDIQDWMENQNISYFVTESLDGTHLSDGEVELGLCEFWFESDADAILFKIEWTGKMKSWKGRIL